MKTLAIIVSAGRGKRFGDSLPKQFHLIAGIPVIARTLLCFERSKIIDKICLVIDRRYEDYYQRINKRYKFQKIFNIVQGGKERQHSVYNGLMSSGEEWDIVVIHDGVRPLVTEELLRCVVGAAKKFGSAVPGVNPYDTLKIKSRHSYVEETLDREIISSIQTPQAFRYDIIKEAHVRALKEKYIGTDDAELVERLGRKVRIVEGDRRNIKITTKYDIAIAEALLKFLD